MSEPTESIDRADEDDFTHYFNATGRLQREVDRLRAQVAALTAVPFDAGYFCVGCDWFESGPLNVEDGACQACGCPQNQHHEAKGMKS